MKYKLIIDENHEEEIIIYAHNKNDKVDELISFLDNKVSTLNGYFEDEVYILDLENIYCFIIENTKTYALYNKTKLVVKYRLYELENILNNNFIKINQSCIINIKHIKKFTMSFFSSLMVELKNGYIDYVSRRNIKSVKERLGI